MGSPHSVFIDTSVLFAACCSSTGGSRLILKLGEAGVVVPIVSRQVLTEAENVLRRKAPDALATLALLLERSNATIVPSAPSQGVEAFAKATGHPGDAQIVADAAAANVSYLLTLDRTHLLGNEELQKRTPFPILSPGDFLLHLRTRLADESTSGLGLHD